jgi:hypothetical protein
MSGETNPAEEPQYTTREQIDQVLARSPKVASAVHNLDKAIDHLEQIQQELLPKQQKGLHVPGIQEQIYNAQSNLARRLDELIQAANTCTDQEVMGIAMAVNQAGVAYMQGILFGIHYSRMLVTYEGDQPFQRLLIEANTLLDRAHKKKGNGGLIIP